ncbi:MAG: helix-turn-helix transcriptional regulator [Bacteroidota bacterium]|nr:helix-turn-helix transcriptional regulator [Bacteroidota bacterium]
MKMKTMNKSDIYSSPLIEELLNDISPEELEKTKKRMFLAARIDDAIKAKGWKKKDFAKALRKTPSEITKWLSGTHNFTSDTLFEIERILNITLIQLEDKSQETIRTYLYNVTIQSTHEPKGYWDSILYNNTMKQSYKAKSQLNMGKFN